MRSMIGWRWLGSLLFATVLLGLAYLQRQEIGAMVVTLRHAHAGWLAIAIIVQIGVYLMFTVVMHQSLVLVRRPLAFISVLPFSFSGVVLNRLLPAGGASVEVIGLLDRGVPPGATTVVLSLNVLSGIAAFAVLLAGGLGYQAFHGGLGPRIDLTLLAAATMVALVTVIAIRQVRDRAGLTRKVLALHRTANRLLRRSVAPDGALRFVDETYDSIALIRAQALGFVRLIAIHLSTLLLDCAGLMLLFVALGFRPNVVLVLLGYTLAYVVATLSFLPGGGGSFEAAMTVTYTQLGVPAHLALSVTLLYRLLTFWLPLIAVVFTANRIRAPRGAPLAPASRPMPISKIARSMLERSDER